MRQPTLVSAGKQERQIAKTPHLSSAKSAIVRSIAVKRLLKKRPLKRLANSPTIAISALSAAVAKTGLLPRVSSKVFHAAASIASRAPNMFANVGIPSVNGYSATSSRTLPVLKLSSMAASVLALETSPADRRRDHSRGSLDPRGRVEINERA
jgi:hypothetical protein